MSNANQPIFKKGVTISSFYIIRLKTKRKMSIKDFIIGKWRLLFGLCPACNSDAPKMYDCKICDWKNNYNNRKKSEDRKYWWNRYSYFKNKLQ